MTEHAADELTDRRWDVLVILYDMRSRAYWHIARAGCRALEASA